MIKRAPSTPLIGLDPDLPPGDLDFECFLAVDLDGVAHPEGCGAEMEFCFMGNLCDVIRECDPKGLLPLVISSDWRFNYTIAQLRSYFAPDIARQVVGVTPNLFRPPVGGWGSSGGATASPGLRQREIDAWADEYAPAARWLAIDDNAVAFEPDCPHLFRVPLSYEGLGGGLNLSVALDFRQRLREFLAGAKPVSRMQP